jgi:hypothetical protein
MDGTRHRTTGLAALTVVVLASAVLASAAQAASAAVAVKPIPIAVAKKLYATSNSRGTDAFFIAYEATKLIRKHRYPTGTTLATDLTKRWDAFYEKGFHKKFGGKIEAGPVPSPANAKNNYYYVGRSTAKIFRILTVYRFEGHTYKFGYDISGKPKVVGGVETYDRLLAEAQGEVAGAHAADAAYKIAHTATASASWAPAYPTPTTLSAELVDRSGSVATFVAQTDPGPQRYDGGSMYLGGTQPSEFDGVMYFVYAKHQDLRIETTRSLTGSTKFKIASLRVKF